MDPCDPAFTGCIRGLCGWSRVEPAKTISKKIFFNSILNRFLFHRVSLQDWTVYEIFTVLTGFRSRQVSLQEGLVYFYTPIENSRCPALNDMRPGITRSLSVSGIDPCVHLCIATIPASFVTHKEGIPLQNYSFRMGDRFGLFMNVVGGRQMSMTVCIALIMRNHSLERGGGCWKSKRDRMERHPFTKSEERFPSLYFNLFNRVAI